MSFLDELYTLFLDMDARLEAKEKIKNNQQEVQKYLEDNETRLINSQNMEKTIIEQIHIDYEQKRIDESIRDQALNNFHKDAEEAYQKLHDIIQRCSIKISECINCITILDNEIQEIGKELEDLAIQHDKEYSQLSQQTQELISFYILETKKIKQAAELEAKKNSILAFFDNHRFLLFAPPAAKQGTKSVSPLEKANPYPIPQK